jgi:hypothetical protein
MLLQHASRGTGCTKRPSARRKLGGNRFGEEKGEALGPRQPMAAALPTVIILSMSR